MFNFIGEISALIVLSYFTMCVAPVFNCYCICWIGDVNVVCELVESEFHSSTAGWGPRQIFKLSELRWNHTSYGEVEASPRKGNGRTIRISLANCPNLIQTEYIWGFYDRLLVG